MRNIAFRGTHRQDWSRRELAREQRTVRAGRRMVRILSAAYAGHAHPRRRAHAATPGTSGTRYSWQPASHGGLRRRAEFRRPYAGGGMWRDHDDGSWQGPLVWMAQDAGSVPGLFGLTEAEVYEYLLPRWRALGITPGSQRRAGRADRAMHRDW